MSGERPALDFGCWGQSELRGLSGSLAATG